MTTANKTTREGQLQKLLAGFVKHYGNVSSLTTGGVSYTPVELEKLLQSGLDQMAATAKAHADFRTQVQAERDVFAKLNPTLRALKNTIVGQFGDTVNATSVL